MNIRKLRQFTLPCLLAGITGSAQSQVPPGTEIRTPAAPAEPRVNGPSVFGARPGSDFLYTIPATGQRPMTFAVKGLPEGLNLDPATGRITGRLSKPGETRVTMRATNALGSAEKAFRIICGPQIGLTPTLGWNSWNCWAGAVDQEKVLKSARAMVNSGLAQHGWSYVNIDDTWQGTRDPKTLALQSNERFPDMKKLCDEIHGMGLKAGIYSGPWVTTYAGFNGGSSDEPNGSWKGQKDFQANWRFGKHSFAVQDAQQWARWGFDYLKYDWNPNDLPHTREMSQALKSTGRDILYSLSNTAPIADGAAFAELANSWRTTGDIWDTWEVSGPYQNSVSEIGFSQDPWTPFGGPGHFNDPDMLVIGWVGWGPDLHSTRLTADEQYSHITLWCMLASPLLIGCDMDRLDPFTLNLLTNDEVLAINQDALGRQGRRVKAQGPIDIYRKDLEDGGAALALFNRGGAPHTIHLKLDRIGFNGKLKVRDLWRQKDLGVFKIEGYPTQDFTVTIAPHSVELFKVSQ